MKNENQDNQKKPEQKNNKKLPAKQPRDLAFDHDPFSQKNKNRDKRRK